MTTPVRHSAIYSGVVQHRRRDEVEHRFAYRVFQVYVDLDELSALQAPGGALRRRLLRPWRFRRQDYLPSDRPLRETVLDTVEGLLGERPDGPVRMLTNLRTFGYLFNPVTFYYCFRRDGALHSVLAEITNTPWRQRHCYAVRADGVGACAKAEFGKRFHISPFQPMEQRYQWTLTAPGDVLQVSMQNRRVVDGPVVFTASLSAARQPLTPASMRRVTCRHPWITAKVILGIHWQALRLWWKGAKFHRHPDKRDAAAAPTDAAPRGRGERPAGTASGRSDETTREEALR